MRKVIRTRGVRQSSLLELQLAMLSRYEGMTIRVLDEKFEGDGGTLNMSKEKRRACDVRKGKKRESMQEGTI